MVEPKRSLATPYMTDPNSAHCLWSPTELACQPSVGLCDPGYPRRVPAARTTGSESEPAMGLRLRGPNINELPLHLGAAHRSEKGGHLCQAPT